MRLEECIFSDNAPPALPLLLADNRNASGTAGSDAGFYSDEEGEEICQYTDPSLGGENPGCTQGAAWPITAAEAGVFLGADEDWVVATRQVRGACMSVCLSAASVTTKRVLRAANYQE